MVCAFLPYVHFVDGRRVIATLETVVEDGEVEGEMPCLPHYGGVKVCVKLSVGASDNV